MQIYLEIFVNQLTNPLLIHLEVQLVRAISVV